MTFFQVGSGAGRSSFLPRDSAYQSLPPSLLDSSSPLHSSLSLTSHYLQDIEHQTPPCSQTTHYIDSLDSQRSFHLSTLAFSQMEGPTTQKHAPLTAAEKKHRRDNDLCLYCGDPGHKVSECSRRSTKRSASGPETALPYKPVLRYARFEILCT